jgi:hypothetical protein
MRKIGFSKKQVEAAAQFIFFRNHVLVKNRKLTSWQDVEEIILDEIRRIASREELPDWVSTGGWILVLEDCGDHVVCEVFVDPTVSEDVLMNDFIIGGE